MRLSISGGGVLCFASFPWSFPQSRASLIGADLFEYIYPFAGKIREVNLALGRKGAREQERKGARKVI